MIGKKVDDYVVLYSWALGEHFMMYNDKTGRTMKQKCVLTNAFENVEVKRKNKKYCKSNY